MLAGPLVLQVSSARDITQPEKGVGGDGHKRMMFLLLTDGRSICRCLEYKSVNDLSKAMAPGTKVQIKNAVVRLGIILLEPKSVQVGSLIGCLNGFASCALQMAVHSHL